MGSGCWTTQEYTNYSRSVGRTVNECGVVTTCYSSAQDLFTSKKLDDSLNPFNIVRECCDTKEHPETFPVILALDVTGSMGESAMTVAKKLNVIITDCYEKIKDIEFAIMGIGDLSYDKAPIQMSQFESDIRIAENLDKIWFEGGGGGNGYESYTAAWYMGLKHCNLDCWKRNKKGLIITIGDELLNPYLPSKELYKVTGDSFETSIETKKLYKEVSDKYDIKHIVVDHNNYNDYESCKKSFASVIGSENVFSCKVDEIVELIISIISDATKNDCHCNSTETINPTKNNNGMICW